tara:strand:- start:437 stop:820 length:384 start_codon:yes stop_codon:yes gene_type:complete
MKTKLLTICLLLVTSQVFAAWHKVSENTDGMEFYLDFDNMRKHSGYIYIWSIDNYLKPNKYGILSEKIYNEIDCKKLRVRYLSGTFHEQPMGEGPASIHEMNNLNQWTSYPQGTSGDTVLKAACSVE